MYICAQEDFIIKFYCECVQEDNSTRLHLGVPLLGVNTDIKKRKPMGKEIYTLNRPRFRFKLYAYVCSKLEVTGRPTD